jgi:hypothetical protein
VKASLEDDLTLRVPTPKGKKIKKKKAHLSAQST